MDGKISNVLFKLKPILNLLETMFARNLRPMPVMFENMLKTIREKYPDRPFYATYERRMASGSIVVWQTRKTAPIQSVRDDDVKIIYPAYKDVNLEVKLDEARRFVNKVKFTIKLVEESSLSEEDKSMFSSLLKSILKMMSQNAAWVMNCSLKIEEQVSSLKTMLNMKRVNKKDLAKINEQLTKAVRKFNEKYICWRKAEQNFWYRVEPFLGLLATQVSQSLILQKKHLMYMNKCK
ncbi:uncharacterized protein LOC106661435 isoform X2 [Cimex lectularius]|uniref:Uncharacterized protein n=1 Tax=Cimex lectularius TaxID=79782 RepID=A0A8I6R751_CIMLE|nr:uncharacterized protein LOC106661435 isoform X2 [Cimex lectularius]